MQRHTQADPLTQPELDKMREEMTPREVALDACLAELARMRVVIRECYRVMVIEAEKPGTMHTMAARKEFEKALEQEPAVWETFARFRKWDGSVSVPRKPRA